MLNASYNILSKNKINLAQFKKHTTLHNLEGYNAVICESLHVFYNASILYFCTSCSSREYGKSVSLYI